MPVAVRLNTARVRRGIAFANNNAQLNKGTTPALCAIFAISSGNWRNVIRKAFIPESLVGDSSDKAKAQALENARLDFIRKAVPGVTPQSVVKFALFNRKSAYLCFRCCSLCVWLTGRGCVLPLPAKSGQLVIPEAIGNPFSAKCFKVQGNAVAPSDVAASNQGTASFPGFSYNGATLRTAWKIAPETAG